MDVCPCAIEIFRDVYQCVGNAEESSELASKHLQRCCEYSVCHVLIILDIQCMCAFVLEDVWRFNLVYLEYDEI